MTYIFLDGSDIILTADEESHTEANQFIGLLVLTSNDEQRGSLHCIWYSSRNRPQTNENETLIVNNYAINYMT